MGTSAVSEPLNFFIIVIFEIRERSGSVVECLTRDLGAAVEPHLRRCVVSLSKTHLS